MEMSASSMLKQQESSDAWTLSPGVARRLPASGTDRRLAVMQGRVWLTRSAIGCETPEDIWLSAGEQIVVDPGTEVVLEGWPSARVALLGRAAAPSFSVSRASSALRRWRERAQWSERPAPCV
jgi:hypothetical protein